MVGSGIIWDVKTREGMHIVEQFLCMIPIPIQVLRRLTPIVQLMYQHLMLQRRDVNCSMLRV